MTALRLSAYLCSHGSVYEHVLESYIKFAHIVFPEPVLVPAFHLEQQRIYVLNWKLQPLIPFWIQVLRYRYC